jgi:peptidoglycan/LPS O-acetylase OafA/YrhL
VPLDAAPDSQPAAGPQAAAAPGDGQGRLFAEPAVPERGAARPGGYNPALDGVRALAVLAVLVFHLNALKGGYLGVDVFFVLSGFLISGLLLAEWDRTGTLSLRRFYVRRAFRLLPAFWLLAAVGVGSVALLRVDPGDNPTDFYESAAAALAYLNNYFQVLRPGSGGGWFGHSWSLSLEEQFYVLWPLALLLLCRRRGLAGRLPAVLSGAVIVIALWRAVLALTGAQWTRMYFALDTRADALMVGCALAAWLRGPRTALARPTGLSRAVLPVAGPTALGLLAVAMVVMPDVSEPGARILFEGGYTVVALVTGVLILALELRRPAWLFRVLAVGPLAWLGRISYGFYLWHFPVVGYWGPRLMDRLGRWPGVLAAGVISLALASASFYLLEQPVQRRRPRWAATPTAPPTARTARGRDRAVDEPRAAAPRAARPAPGGGRTPRPVPQPRGSADRANRA